VWVVGIVKESLGSFEINSVSSYFDKVLEVHTVGVRDTIPRLQVLHGICLISTASLLRGMFLLESTFLLCLYVFSPVTHTNATYKGSRESW
jgi:hypothetical protein